MVNLILSFHINNIVKILKYRFSSTLFNSFTRIKRIYEQSQINKLKSKLIFNNLEKKLKALILINKRAKKRVLKKAFYKYRNIIYTRNKLSKLKYEFDHTFDKKKEKELSNLDLRLNEKDKELSESKKQLEINFEHTNELAKKIRLSEDNLVIFNQTYKKLEVKTNRI